MLKIYFNLIYLIRLSNLLGFSIYEVEDILVDLENEKNNLNEIFEIMR